MLRVLIDQKFKRLNGSKDINVNIRLISSTSKDLNNLVLSNETKGSRIEISGKIFDGNNDIVKDALVEIWQVDLIGNYKSRVNNNSKSDPNFNNWGRTTCDLETGLWQFHTIKPGIIKLTNRKILAPHIWLWVVARGINIGLFTCMYFCDEKKSFLTLGKSIGEQLKSKSNGSYKR